MLRVVLVVVPETLLISERCNSINYPLGTAIKNSYTKQSYTGLSKRAQDLKQMKFCPILAIFCCCKFKHYLEYFYSAK